MNCHCNTELDGFGDILASLVGPKCSPGILVSGSIKFVRIFAGVLLQRRRQTIVGCFNPTILA